MAKFHQIPKFHEFLVNFHLIWTHWNSQNFHSKSIPNMCKCLKAKLFPTSRPSQPNFISNFWSRRRSYLDQINFGRVWIEFGLFLNPFETGPVRCPDLPVSVLSLSFSHWPGTADLRLPLEPDRCMPQLPPNHASSTPGPPFLFPPLCVRTQGPHHLSLTWL
jgi:hypothetical protein